MGIEPTRSAWKAEVLPLNYTRGLPGRPPCPPKNRLKGNHPRLRRSAFPGRCAMRDTLQRLRASGQTSAGFILPRQTAENQLWPGGGEDSNLRRLSRQIYSLIPLATREPSTKPGIVLQAILVSTGFEQRQHRPLRAVCSFGGT